MPHTIYALLVGEFAILKELRQEVRSSFNGTGYQLRKERYKRKESNDIFCRLDVSTIYINGVTEGLERIERNADRKNNLKQKAIGANTKEMPKFRNKEIIIFERCKDSEVQYNIGYQPEFLCEWYILPPPKCSLSFWVFFSINSPLPHEQKDVSAMSSKNLQSHQP